MFLVPHVYCYFFTDESELIEPPRADFRGHPRISPITGLSEQYYPTWKRRVKIYCVSYPLLIISLKFAVIGMWIYFDLQQSIKKAYGDKSGIIAKIIKTIPSVMYASVIFLVNNLYSKIATKLNDWGKERHINIKELKRRQACLVQL